MLERMLAPVAARVIIAATCLTSFFEFVFSFFVIVYKLAMFNFMCFSNDKLATSNFQEETKYIGGIK